MQLCISGDADFLQQQHLSIAASCLYLAVTRRQAVAGPGPG